MCCQLHQCALDPLAVLDFIRNPCETDRETQNGESPLVFLAVENFSQDVEKEMRKSYCFDCLKDLRRPVRALADEIERVSSQKEKSKEEAPTQQTPSASAHASACSCFPSTLTEGMTKGESFVSGRTDTSEHLDEARGGESREGKTGEETADDQVVAVQRHKTYPSSSLGGEVAERKGGKGAFAEREGLEESLAWLRQLVDIPSSASLPKCRRGLFVRRKLLLEILKPKKGEKTGEGGGAEGEGGEQSGGKCVKPSVQVLKEICGSILWGAAETAYRVFITKRHARAVAPAVLGRLILKQLVAAEKLKRFEAELEEDVDPDEASLKRGGRGKKKKAKQKPKKEQEEGKKEKSLQHPSGVGKKVEEEEQGGASMLNSNKHARSSSNLLPAHTRSCGSGVHAHTDSCGQQAMRVGGAGRPRSRSFGGLCQSACTLTLGRVMEEGPVAQSASLTQPCSQVAAGDLEILKSGGNSETEGDELSDDVPPSVFFMEEAELFLKDLEAEAGFCQDHQELALVRRCVLAMQALHCKICGPLCHVHKQQLPPHEREREREKEAPPQSNGGMGGQSEGMHGHLAAPSRDAVLKGPVGRTDVSEGCGSLRDAPSSFVPCSGNLDVNSVSVVGGGREGDCVEKGGGHELERERDSLRGGEGEGEGATTLGGPDCSCECHQRGGRGKA
uniref:Uncharacterized protein n=1 Tax=Chromera velia CCMP2878 TaxID=1169474 RepID=A0A0G4HJ29_9ALVE|eukprot:Cvel_28118.t1-p1 / transcript=Cvel_28118.t1 / gene=Cvel_28118 / organism=Chromera_velia_CCMP2878 / gene_product=hypothetical protein / transcript_product=hypothetical protein / location=Cvel_scaffold3623:7886-13149(-) / protein_length=674 / sequence_SO=supercontig / SO=protein_coding / is_pseudo=false